ncbi:hypothetical protein GQ54DRAFT_71431 [Martensiomyces pterosporus]|nr:hypothetical protein GQ54DRAFT_71431 [Martensiomyces pterosporus]
MHLLSGCYALLVVSGTRQQSPHLRPSRSMHLMCSGAPGTICCTRLASLLRCWLWEGPRKTRRAASSRALHARREEEPQDEYRHAPSCLSGLPRGWSRRMQLLRRNWRWGRRLLGKVALAAPSRLACRIAQTPYSAAFLPFILHWPQMRVEPKACSLLLFRRSCPHSTARLILSLALAITRGAQLLAGSMPVFCIDQDAEYA